MKSTNPHYEIFDYSVCDDYILYPSINYVVKSNFPKQNIGIFLLEIKDWKETNKHIMKLYRYSLIDSFSLQITISTSIRLILILKIVCLGANELNYRYNNLKDYLKKNGNCLLLRNAFLEETFLSIIDPIKFSSLNNTIIYRDKNRFYAYNQEKIKKYFLLLNLSVLWTSQNSRKITTLIELLHATNLKCFLVFYSKHLGDSSQSNYYLFACHSNYSYLAAQLKELLNQCSYQNKISNIFHPTQLGRILTRGPIEMKYLKTTILPPILNMNLYLESKSPILENNDTFNKIVKEYSHELLSTGCYALFNGELILFHIEKLNTSSIKKISENLGNSFKKCVLFFESQSDFDLFNKKMRNSPKTRKTIPISELSELKKILEKFKITNFGLETPSY